MIVDTTCTITHTTVADASAWYSVPFQYETILGIPQITVTLSDDELTYVTDYIVGVSGIQLTTAPTAGMKLVIYRSTPFEQTTDFQTGYIDPDEIEHSFDLSVMRDQELSARLDVVEELPEDHEERITAIEEVIPAEATPSNKLGDKAFIASSIATETSRAVGIEGGLQTQITTNKGTMDGHIANTSNPHNVTKAQVGLSNVDDTSDLDKPVSTATQAALNNLSIDDMTDVDISSVQDGEFLRYNGLTSKWENAASTASVGFSGITGSPYDNTLLGKELSIKTNCITEIPQDIKLELNAGTLTLKAGSKLYVPNGAGVFDTVTIASDLTTTASTDGVMFVFIRQDGTLLFGEYNQESGTSTPTNQWTTYYNTNDNKVYRYTTSTTTPSYQASFPIAKITVSGGAITSIDQIFNGFGYIGCTRFALPGIKWLSPDGRNADGTLKSVLRTNTSVLIETLAIPGIEVVNVLGTGSLWTSSKYIESEDEPTGNYIIWYKPSENILRNKETSDWNINNNIVVCGFFDNSTGTNITNLYIRQPFCAVDNSDLIFLLNTLYPIGSIYLGTQSSCPLATLIPGSTWTQIQGRYLLASGTLHNTSETYTAGSYVSAGLPNTTGSLQVFGTSGKMSANSVGTGVFSIENTGSAGGLETTGSYQSGKANFSLSSSNSMYGASATNRPAAYVVNVWRRTA